MSIKHRWPLHAVLLGAGAYALVAGPALADPAPPFSELLRQAQSAPTLAESRSEVDQAQGLAQQAAVRPNPSVSVLVENFGGSRPYDGLDGYSIINNELAVLRCKFCAPMFAFSFVFVRSTALLYARRRGP